MPAGRFDAARNDTHTVTLRQIHISGDWADCLKIHENTKTPKGGQARPGQFSFEKTIHLGTPRRSLYISRPSKTEHVTSL